MLALFSSYKNKGGIEFQDFSEVSPFDFSRLCSKIAKKIESSPIINQGLRKKGPYLSNSIDPALSSSDSGVE